MFRSESKKVKNGLKLNVMFTLFVQFLVENRILPNYLPFNWITLEIKMLSRSSHHYEVGFCFFWPLAGSHSVIFNQLTCLQTCQLKRSNASKTAYGKPHYKKLLNYFPSVYIQIQITEMTHQRSTALEGSVRNYWRAKTYLTVPTSTLFLMWIKINRCMVHMKYP